tara:strand:- start:15036 stop:15383 length:348 start_codon:yes stop_codon:yes gene_type:complete
MPAPTTTTSHSLWPVAGGNSQWGALAVQQHSGFADSAGMVGSPRLSRMGCRHFAIRRGGAGMTGGKIVRHWAVERPGSGGFQTARQAAVTLQRNNQREGRSELAMDWTQTVEGKP